MDTPTCPRCQMHKLPGARFCSNCGTALKAEGDDRSTPPLPAPPTAFGVEVPPPRRRRTPLWIGLGVAAVAVAVVVVWLLMADRSRIEFPDSLAGQSRLTSPAIEGVADAVARGAAVGSLEPKVAVYGRGAAPSLMVLAYDGQVPGDMSPFFQGAMGGFEGTSGASVDRSSVVIETRGSTTYQCASFSGGRGQGWLCIWGDDQTFGLLAILTPSIGQGVDAAAFVHDAVVMG
jgi:hypothetical protein